MRCSYISFLHTFILYFRSLNYINSIISIVIDGETIVSLQKKGEINSTIAKEIQIRCETVWKLVKKFRKTGQTSNRPGQGRKRTVRTKRMVKNTREIWEQIPVVRRPNWPQRLESARLRCATFLRRISRPSPTRYRSAMSSHPRMNEWWPKDIDTFWTSWKMACCPIWGSLTRRNLTLSSASIIKTTVLGVGMHPCKEGEWVDARSQPLLWFGRPSQPLEALPSFLCPKEWNWTGRWTVAMGPRALRGSTLDLPARLGALTWLKNDPTVDSGPHPGVH